MALNVLDIQSEYNTRKNKEGVPANFFFETTFSSATIGNASLTSFFVPIGKYRIVERLVVEAPNDTPIEIACQIVATITANNVDQTANNIIGLRSLDAVRFDPRGYVYKGHDFSPVKEGSWFGMFDRTTMIIQTRDTGVTGYSGKVLVSMIATDYDMDRNYGAQRLHIGAGDSILAYTNGGVGYTYKDVYFSLITEYYQNNKTVGEIFYPGQSIRQSNRAAGGRTSTNGEDWRKAGWYDLDGIDLCTYNFMVNDAGSSPFTQPIRDTWKANLRAFINWYQSRYPRKALIIVSGTPVTDNTMEANLVLLRQDGFDVVSEYEGTLTDGTELSVSNPLSLFNDTAMGKIVYINAGIAFDRTDIQYYNSTAGNGDGLHPNAVRGHAAIMNQCIRPALDAWLPRIA